MRRLWVVLLLLSLGMIGLWAVLGPAQVETEWVRRYSPPDESRIAVTALAIDPSGNVIMTGQSCPGLLEKCDDIHILKYSPEGELLWERQYDGPAGGEDRPTDLAIDSDGNIIIIGVSEGVGTEVDWITLKYNPNGELLWQRRVNGSGSSFDVAVGLELDPNDQICVAGTVLFGGTGSGDLVERPMCLKYDTEGQEVWRYEYRGLGEGSQQSLPTTSVMTGSAMDQAGNVFLAIKSAESGQDAEMVTVKLRDNGVPIWIRTYAGGEATETGPALIQTDRDDNVLIVVYSIPTDVPPEGTILSALKYDSVGNLLWTYHFGDEDGVWVYTAGLGFDSEGNAVILCDSHMSVAEGEWRSAYETIKLLRRGALAWKQSLATQVARMDKAVDFCLDSADRIYLTGTFADDILTMSYSSDGELLWKESYGGPEGLKDWASAIAVDPEGSVYVAGTSSAGESRLEMVLIKYSLPN